LTYKNLNVLAVIPARGGSKSIPRKNLQLVDGVSLVGRAALVAKSLVWLDNTIISSDDPEIIQEAERYGIDAPFIRPHELSNDEATSKDMWRHAWLSAEEFYGKTFDISLLLEPTSPLRLPEDIEKVMHIMHQNCAPAVVTISRTPAHFTPHKTLTLNDGDEIGFFLKHGLKYSRRQDIPVFYHRNGVCYAVHREHLIDRNQIMESGAIATIIDRPVVNIDEPIDLKIANWLIDSAYTN
jgi:CMP-N,N'-diacetyllegionaminic acid synthase